MSDDDVGYKKPPKHTRFKKGQSGNPNGRPKGSGALHGDLARELAKKITVTENGRVRKITKGEALITSLINSATGHCQTKCTGESALEVVNF